MSNDTDTTVYTHECCSCGVESPTEEWERVDFGHLCHEYRCPNCGRLS